MLTVTNASVMNFEGAIRGARNPLASWDKADSAFYKYLGKDDNGNDMVAELDVPIIGENDMGLLKRLRNAGDPSHRKFMRQIMVCADIEAPIYWY